MITQGIGQGQCQNQGQGILSKEKNVLKASEEYWLKLRFRSKISRAAYSEHGSTRNQKENFTGNPKEKLLGNPRAITRIQHLETLKFHHQAYISVLLY